MNQFENHERPLTLASLRHAGGMEGDRGSAEHCMLTYAIAYQRAT